MCELTLGVYALTSLTAEQSGLFERGRPIRFAGRGLIVDGQPCFISESQRGAERLAARPIMVRLDKPRLRKLFNFTQPARV